MKKVFFIGKFNAFYEEKKQFLSGYFNVQVCVDNVSMVKGMIRLNQPDIVIVSLMAMEAQNAVILKELKEHYPDISKLCMGTDDDFERFKDDLADGDFRLYSISGDNKKLLEQIYAELHVDYNVNGSMVSSPNKNKRSILLIDDSPMLLRVMNEILKVDYDVQMATSASKALALLRKRRPDIIFLDYDMPECDGRMTLQMIREIDEAKDVPVIFLTGVNDTARIKAVLALHPAGYMLKPANREMLYEVLDKHLK